jgi:CheY-like chemotaxis protein
MKLNALLMCREVEALRMLVAGLDELDIEEEACVTAPEAMELLAQGFYSALIVDFDLPGAATVAHMARLAPAKRRPVVVAMISPQTDIAGAYQAGANFIVYKPLVHEQMMRALRAGRGFMQPDRRRSSREKVESMVYLRFGDVCPLPALVQEVSEDGLSVQAAEPLPAIEVPIRFILPGTVHMIEGTGDVVWADETGRAGILFHELNADSRRQLRDWLRNRQRSKPRKRGAVVARAAKARASAAHPAMKNSL